MGFLQSGQFQETYSGENLKPCMKIYFSEMWPDVVDKFLKKLKDIYQEYGCNLVWVFDPRETNKDEE